MRIKLSCTFLFSLILSLGVHSQRIWGNIFVRDDRVSLGVEEIEKELLPVGTLQRLESEGRGTAFLVSPCLILTNRHVAFTDFEDPDLNETSSFRLIDGRRSKATPVKFGKRNEKTEFENEFDWALLRLEECLGKSVGWLEPVLISLNHLILNATPLELAGYPSDRHLQYLTLDQSCRMRDVPWRHDCATRSGNSGSPIYIKGEVGKESTQALQVVAISASSIGGFAEIVKEYDVYLSNGAVPVVGFWHEIEDLVIQDRTKVLR